MNNIDKIHVKVCFQPSNHTASDLNTYIWQTVDSTVSGHIYRQVSFLLEGQICTPIRRAHGSLR